LGACSSSYFSLKKKKLISTTASGGCIEHIYREEVFVSISITQSPLYKSFQNLPGLYKLWFPMGALDVTSCKSLLVTGTGP
jgi:hypothetical protein